MKRVIESLILELNTIEECFHKVKTINEDYDFYKVVVPYTQEIDKKLQSIIDNKSEIIELVYMNDKKFDLLIKSYKELSVDCHFHKTSRKLFTEKLKAVNYDLKYIYQNLK
ncbi:DUF1798 family protein [Staphylococcus taiwanensis]|nr:DUF1798 family protein [Staphylococcus taiwanensis]